MRAGVYGKSTRHIPPYSKMGLMSESNRRKRYLEDTDCLGTCKQSSQGFFEILDVQLLNQNSPSIDGDGIQSTETWSRVVTSTTFLHQTVDPEVAVKLIG